MFVAGSAMPSRFDPLTWHIHEMLFGFVMAAIAGFLLTAIPNWTGRLPVSGGPLALLAGFWVLGRIACLVSALVLPWIAIAADLSFPVALVGVVTRETVAGRNWRNLAVLAPVSVLGIANLLMHLEANGVVVPSGLGWRLGLAAVIVLISVMAGRIVPSFTRNWLAKRPRSDLPAGHGRIDRVALGILHAGLIGWAFLPALWPVGLLLPLSAAIHALTAGAIGTMILAVMTRATRGHVGRELSADRVTVLIYVLVTLAAITRVGAAFGATWTMPLLIISACLWIATFAGFVLSYGPMLILPRRPR